MKKLSTFALTRAVIIGLFALGGLTFAVAFITNNIQTHKYRSTISSISISNPKVNSETKIEASNPTCEATFEFDGEELSDISSFQFIIPITELKYDNDQTEASIQQLLQSNNSNEIHFAQQQVMVLPKMKMIHLIGEISIANVKRNIAFQLTYDLNDNKEITLIGKQSFRFSDFGIMPPNNLEKFKGELNLNLEIKMEKDNGTELKPKFLP